MPAPAAAPSSAHHVHNPRTSTPNGDFYAVARDLERRLGSLRTFLDAAHELLARAKLPGSEFRRCSREIVDLIETGRETLVRAGIKLYRFTSCPPGLLPYKSVYFGLLAVLRHNRRNIEPRIRDRVARLLFALSTRFVIVRAAHDTPPLDALHAPAAGEGEDEDEWSRWRTNPVTSGRPVLVSASVANEPARYAHLMPPPNAFPPGRREFSVEVQPRGRSRGHALSRAEAQQQLKPAPRELARTAIPRRPARPPAVSPAAHTAHTAHTVSLGSSRKVRHRQSFGIFFAASGGPRHER